MIALLLFLAIPAFSQTIAGPESATSSTDQNTIDTLTQQVACISSGNCQLTGTPNFQNGLQINGVQLATGPLSGIFTSTITVGVSTYTLVLNYNSVIKGGWSIVGATHTYSAVSSTFTNFNPNYPTRVDYRCGFNSLTDGIAVRFGASSIDTGNNYNYHISCINGGGGGCGTQGAGVSFIKLIPAPSGANPAQWSNGEFEILTDTGAFRTATITHQDSTNDGSGGTATLKDVSGAGNYTGAATIGQFAFYNIAGPMNCLIFVSALVPPLDPP